MLIGLCRLVYTLFFSVWPCLTRSDQWQVSVLVVLRDSFAMEKRVLMIHHYI